jgi:hypothetical protein
VAPVYSPQGASPAVGRQHPDAPMAQCAMPLQSRAMQYALIIFAAVVLLAGLGVGGWYGYTKIKIRIARSHLPPGSVETWLEGNRNIDKNYIIVPSSPTLALMQQTHQLSIAAWIKPYSLPCEFPAILCKGSTTRSDIAYGGYIFTLNANGDNDLVFMSGGFEMGTHNANGRWINHHLGEWIHVAFTVDGTTRIGKFYVNGKPTNDETTWGSWDGLNFDVPSDLYIGSGDESRGSNPVFDGPIRSLVLYQRVLTPDEIQNLCDLTRPAANGFDTGNPPGTRPPGSASPTPRAENVRY